MLTPEWTEYLNQIKIHRPGAPAIFNLIYMGACDNFIVAPEANNMPLYALMCHQVKKALGSKAGLSKGTKTDDIGLADVKNPLDLIRWRINYNPISKSNLIGLWGEQLTKLNYRAQPHKMFPFEKKREGKLVSCAITTRLTDFLNHYPKSPLFNNIASGMRNLELFGLVLDVKFFKYKAGSKEAMKLSIYTGDELLEIVCWPDKSGSVPVAMMEKVRKNQAALFLIKPRLDDNGKGTYRLADITKLETPEFKELTSLVVEDKVEEVIKKERKPRAIKEKPVVEKIAPVIMPKIEFDDLFI